MWRIRFVSIGIAGTLLACTQPASAQTQGGLYRIVSGDYLVTGGIVPLRSFLPTESQAYVRFTTEGTGSATLTFLGADMQLLKFRPCPDAPQMDYSLSGFVFSEFVLFQGPQSTCRITGSYIVTNAPGQLRIDGELESDRGMWSDFPNNFRHRNVVAVLVPEPTIRVSEVEICWLAVSNTTYQVQYRDALNANVWTDLGAPLSGNGTTNCVTDKVAAGQPRRFYRAMPLPR
jgi:hypothetical protein